MTRAFGNWLPDIEDEVSRTILHAVAIAGYTSVLSLPTGGGRGPVRIRIQWKFRGVVPDHVDDPVNCVWYTLCVLPSGNVKRIARNIPYGADATLSARSDRMFKDVDVILADVASTLKVSVRNAPQTTHLTWSQLCSMASSSTQS